MTPSGAPMTREAVREATGAQNIVQEGTGVGYQELGKNNTIG